RPPLAEHLAEVVAVLPGDGDLLACRLQSLDDADFTVLGPDPVDIGVCRQRFGGLLLADGRVPLAVILGDDGDPGITVEYRLGGVEVDLVGRGSRDAPVHEDLALAVEHLRQSFGGLRSEEGVARVVDSCTGDEGDVVRAGLPYGGVVGDEGDSPFAA